METISLSLRAQVAVGTFFMKSPVLKKKDYNFTKDPVNQNIVGTGGFGG